MDKIACTCGDVSCLGTDAAVAFENVSVALGGVRILENVTAEIPRGSATAIIGPNGAGKTTLLLSLLGEVSHAGTVRLIPRDGGKIPPRLGYVPQRLDYDRGMPLTVMDMMVLGRQRLPLWLGTRSHHRRRAMEMLACVRAEHLAARQLGALSGGELQRVMLALAIQQEPEILLLDEPASGADIAAESLLCELLEKLRRDRGFTQIMVTHDLSLVTAHSTHVICLNRRVMGQGPTRRTLRSDVLAATFGIHLGLADLDGGHPHGEGHRHD
jgi:zinc transport system ATP-binding protein